MTLVRWRPLRNATSWNSGSDIDSAFSNLHGEIDHMFNRFMRGGTIDDGASVWLPAVDVTEEQDKYILNIELPGVRKDDVKITMVDDVLTIRGEKKQEKETKEKNCLRVERTYGSFQRSFTLPASIHGGKTEASYDNGVLTVTLPKSEEAKPKEIEVKVK